MIKPSLTSNWLAGIALIALLSEPLPADVSGTWNTTGLTRIVISSLTYPETQPERTVEIGDGTYIFGPINEFSAADIFGKWKQRRGDYTVRPNRAVLEATYIQALQNSPDPPVINDVTLVRSSIIGSQLDDGIWGTENYVYRLDLGEGLERQVLRVGMTVRVAGHPSTTALTATAIPERTRNLADVAAAAVMRYRSNHPGR